MTDTEVAATSFAVVSAAVSALVWWMTREAAAGRILAKNRTFGIRTRHTLVSDEAWMRGQAVASRSNDSPVSKPRAPKSTAVGRERRP